MSETGAGMPYQPPQKQRAPGAGPAGPKDAQPGHGDGSGGGTPQRAAAPGQTPAPYGVGDNRRQYGTMPMRGSVGTPPGMGQGRGGFQPPSYGPPGSGSAGMPNTPGGGMASGLSQPGGRVPDEVRRRMAAAIGRPMGPNGEWGAAPQNEPAEQPVRRPLPSTGGGGISV